MKYRIHLSPPHMSGREMPYIQEAFDKNYIAPVGSNIDAFEETLCQYTGCKYALALSSGTAALHLALAALGVGQGDIVLCQSLTFVATANPIRYVGATPVFIDSEPVTWNICPNALEDAIRHYIQLGIRPKAVIAVHLYGMPARMEEIVYLCQKYGIRLVEDAAEALGSKYRGRMAGTFGDAGILSFNGNKIITTSAGGAFLTDNAAYYAKARFLAMQAREPARHYVHSEVGYNYRMSNVCAGIGRGQLEVIEERVERRRAVHTFYRQALADISNLRFQNEPDGFHSNFWLTAIEVLPGSHCRPETIINSLEKAGIEARPVWKPMHCQHLFKESPRFGGRVSEDLFDYGICLPSGSGLTDADLREISDLVVRVLSEC